MKYEQFPDIARSTQKSEPVLANFRITRHKSDNLVWRNNLIILTLTADSSDSTTCQLLAIKYDNKSKEHVVIRQYIVEFAGI